MIRSTCLVLRSKEDKASIDQEKFELVELTNGFAAKPKMASDSDDGKSIFLFCRSEDRLAITALAGTLNLTVASVLVDLESVLDEPEEVEERFRTNDDSPQTGGGLRPPADQPV